MTRLLHLVLELEDDTFDDDDAMNELLDVLDDHRETRNLVDLNTSESEQANTWLDETGDSIPCFVRSASLETVL